jgi:hypothetical protein
MGLSDNYQADQEFLRWDYKGEKAVQGKYVSVHEYVGDDYVAPVLTLQEDGEALQTSVPGFRSVLADKIRALEALDLTQGTVVEVVPLGQPAGKRYFAYDIFYEGEDGKPKKVRSPKKDTGAGKVAKVPF